MKKRKNSTVLLASIICSSILLLAFSCDADIPIREMAGAKNAIVDAKKYDADKHAPDDMKKAEALLIQSHTQLIDGQDEDAEKSANDAALAANNAKNKSLKPYADSKIKQSDEMQDAADKAFAERFSPNNFAQGKKLNSEAKAQHGQGDYVKSAETAVSSSNFFAAAIEDSTKNSSSINNEIATVERRLTELRRDKNSGAASANLTRAESSVRNAKNSYAKQDFKASWREIDSAKKELDAAALAINRQRVSASIAEVRADIKNAREGDLPPDAVNDLNAATAELDAADGLLRQNNFRDAEVRVNRAVSLVNSAKAKIKKYEEELALRRAKEESDAKDLAVKSEYEEDDYDMFSDDDDSNLKEKDTKSGDGQFYVVQKRKKNTDTLSGISQRFYKDGSFWPAIFNANKDQIKNPDLIFPGQKLLIPPKPAKRPAYQR